MYSRSTAGSAAGKSPALRPTQKMRQKIKNSRLGDQPNIREAEQDRQQT